MRGLSTLSLFLSLSLSLSLFLSKLKHRVFIVNTPNSLIQLADYGNFRWIEPVKSL